MKKSLCLAVFLFMHFLAWAQGQTWRSSLYPSDWQAPLKANFYSDKLIQDFSFAGYQRGEKPIPTPSAIILDVSKPPYQADATGSEDVTALLQRALDDAGRKKGGAVVYLPPGTYQVSPVPGQNYCLRINSSRVVLRGAGQQQTFLFNASADMRKKAIISITSGTSWAQGENKTRITQDLLHPTRIIPLQSINGFKTGDLVIVRNYIDNDWIEKHHMLAYWKDKGSSLGGQLYCRQILAINARTREITLDIPIRYALETTHDAAVYKAPAMLTEVGVENLSIGNRQSFAAGDWSEESYRRPENPSYQSHDSWAIAMAQVCNGWIRQVASYQPPGNTSGAHLLSNGIKLSQTKNVSLINCDFKRPQFGGGGGNGYMYRIMGNETLNPLCDLIDL